MQGAVASIYSWPITTYNILLAENRAVTLGFRKRIISKNSVVMPNVTLQDGFDIIKVPIHRIRIIMAVTQNTIIVNESL